jgi:GrpB-like predicted nucleotidyltransferase (UPF0157 family)
LQRFQTPSTWPHAIHLHVCQSGETEEWRHLAFRDGLREHAEDRAAYGEPKLELVKCVDESDPAALCRYSAGKTDFIEAILRCAAEETGKLLD